MANNDLAVATWSYGTGEWEGPAGRDTGRYLIVSLIIDDIGKVTRAYAEILTGKREKGSEILVYANRAMGMGDELWGRYIRLAIVLPGSGEASRKIMYKFSEWHSQQGPRPVGYVEPWTTADVDFIYRKVNGSVLSLFDGTDYQGRITWCLVNSILTVDDVNNSPELKEQMVTREGWARWFIDGVQSSNKAAFDRFLNEPIRKQYYTLITFVEKGGNFKTNELKQAEPWSPTPPPDLPDLPDIPNLLFLIALGALGFLYVAHRI